MNLQITDCKTVNVTEIGALVWAKVSGHMAWPAIILENAENQRKLYRYVLFFGTEQTGWVKNKELFSYDSNYDHYSKKKSARLRKAIQAVVKYQEEIRVNQAFLEGSSAVAIENFKVNLLQKCSREAAMNDKACKNTEVFCRTNEENLRNNIPYNGSLYPYIKQEVVSDAEVDIGRGKSVEFKKSSKSKRRQGKKGRIHKLKTRPRTECIRCRRKETDEYEDFASLIIKKLRKVSKEQRTKIELVILGLFQNNPNTNQ